MSLPIFTPAALWFDYQPVGTTTKVVVQVTNPGPSDLKLTLGGDPAFGFGSPSTTDVTLSVQQNPHEITLTFQPTADRPYEGTLSGGGASVSLRGVGVRAADADDAITAEESDPDGPGCSAREINRLQIHVPFGETYLVMGRGLKSPKATYDGFGLRTKKRVFIDAEENVVIQSKGSSVYKAYGDNASLYAVAEDHAVVAAKASASLIGKGGTLIFGGLGGGSLEVNAETGDRDNPLAADGDDSAESVRENRNYVAAAFLGLDVMLGVGLLANTVFQTGRTVLDKTEDKKIRKTVAGVLAGTATALGAALSSAALASSVGGVSGPAGTTIFGEAGVLTGTYGFNASYALGGIAHVAPFATTFGLAEATLASLRTTAVTSYFGTVAVDGKTKVKVHSSKNVTVTAGDAATPGTLILDADKIAIGSQPLTTSCKSITMKSNDLLPTPMAESELKMESGEMVLSAGKSLKIKVGVGPQEATVSIENGMVTILAGRKASSVSLLPDGNAELMGQGVASLTSKTGSAVDVALDVSISASAQVKITGKKVNIM